MNTEKSCTKQNLFVLFQIPVHDMGRNKRDKGFDGGPSKRRAILQIEKPSLKAGQKESKSKLVLK